MAINKINYCGQTLLDLSEDTATAANVLNNKTFHLKNGEIAIGTMTNRGTITATIDEPNGIYTIPKGYHSGSGTVTATYSGYRVATGTYTGASNSHSFTISGLDFQPSNVVLAYYSASSSNATLVMTACTMDVINPDSGSIVHGIRRKTTSTTVTFTANPFTLNNDGFTCTNSNGNFGGTYFYVAWG